MRKKAKVTLAFWTLLVVSVMLSQTGGQAMAFSSLEKDNGAIRLSADRQGTTDVTSKKHLYSEENPHWVKEKCNVCHAAEPQKGRPGLRTSDPMEICLQCHAEDVVHKYIHPAGIPIPESFKKRMRRKWKSKIRLDKNERLTCETCHDSLNQCLPERKYMAKLNPNFLREGPYGKRTEVCYKCHDPDNYKPLVAHDQIEKDGTLKKNKCRLCHVVKEKGKIKSGIKRKQDEYPIINTLSTDRTLLCVRCHKKIDHPTSAFRVSSIKTYRHFIKITEEKKNRLDEMKEKTGIFMPLEPITNRIYCGTCHEPHQPGVFAGEKKRLVPKAKKRLRADNICTYCHDK